MAKKKQLAPTPPLDETQDVFNSIWAYNVIMGTPYSVSVETVDNTKKVSVTDESSVGAMSPRRLMGHITNPIAQRVVLDLNRLYVKAASKVASNTKTTPFTRDLLRHWRKEIRNNLIYYAVKNNLRVPTERNKSEIKPKYKG